MSSRTVFLARLIGLYCILVIPSMVLRRQATMDWMTALLNNAALLWVLSVITLTIGLAMVLAHNVWSGGALPVVVTLVGWARKKLEALEISCQSSSVHVTATFGVATYPVHGQTRDALVAAADEALYQGKRSGRNRVLSYHECLTRDLKAETSKDSIR